VKNTVVDPSAERGEEDRSGRMVWIPGAACQPAHCSPSLAMAITASVPW